METGALGREPIGGATTLSPASWPARALLAVAITFLAASAIQGARQPSNSFPAFYTAAQLLREGQSPTRFYDDAWFAVEAHRFSPRFYDIWSPSPPTAGLLFLPLTPFRLGTARVLWTLVNVALLFWTWQLLRKELALSPSLACVVGALLASSHPVLENLKLGQTHILALALSTWAWREFRRGREVALGGVLATLALTKAGGMLVLVVLVFRRSWAALGTFGAITVGVAAAALPWLPASSWLAWLESVNRQAHAPWLPLPAHQSLPALMFHLGIYQAELNPVPIWNAPAVVAVLVVVIPVLAALGVAWAAWKYPAAGNEVFALALVASLVTIPVTRDYHYCVALMPIAVLLARWQSDTKATRAVLATATALLTVNLHHNSGRFSDGLISLLHYPLLAGGLLVVALLLNQARRAPFGSVASV